MSFESFIMPILAFIMGVVSMYADSKDSKQKWLKYSLISGLVLTCGFSIYFGVQKDIENQQDKARLSKKIDQLENNTTKINNGLETLINRGFTSSKAKSVTPKIREQSDQANKELIPELKQNSGNKELITVQYFPKDVDPDIIQETLQKLGFKLETGKPKITEVSTNSIWFGEKVKIEDVKLVAYTLIRAGVQIKAIRPFRNLSEKNPLLIQIGSDADIQDIQPFTVDKIRETSQFKR